MYPADRTYGQLDYLHFFTASGQEDEGDQEGDGKEGKGNKNDKGQRRKTPTAAGQEGKGKGSKTPTALGQEDKKGGDGDEGDTMKREPLLDQVVNEEEGEGAVGKGKKRKIRTQQ